MRTCIWDRVGVGWLLDPDSDLVSRLARAAAARTAVDGCEPGALLADLDDLDVLIEQRHFGIATGELSRDLASGVLAGWRHRLRVERPSTWGEALGISVHELRWALRDNHVWAAGEDQDLLATVDPRRDEPRSVREPGPVVEESVIDGVLCIRIRQCGGRSRASQDAMLAWQQAHERHFDHDRIVVDLRGNPGGGDGPIVGWIRDHVATEVVWPPWREWRLAGQILNRWNGSIIGEAELHGQPLASEFDRSTYRLDRSSRPDWWTIRRHGQLRDLAPYLLSRSGLKIDLPTASASRHEESMVGFPIDLPIDVQTPLSAVAANFDHIHAAAGGGRKPT